LVKTFTGKAKFLFVLAVLLFASPLCAASKKKKKSAADSVTEETDLSGGKGDSIKVPSQKRTYFHKIDSNIVDQVENGSPESIRSAMSAIRKTSSDYEENEKVLIAVATGIMKTVWPSEKIMWDIPEVSDENPYIGAINSVNQGVFDSSTGNTDFLTTILPAMVVLKNTVDESVLQQCDISIRAALNYRPDSVLANYLMSVLRMKQNNFEGVEKYITVAYGNSPKNEEIALTYVQYLRNIGNQSLAFTVLNGLDTDSNNLAILKQNAYIAFESKNYQSAELYVARVLQQNPNDLEFVLFRARILIEKNDYIHAVSLLDMYSRQDSSSIDYLVLRAKVQLDWSKNTSAATETVEKALQLYPDNLDALMFAAKISSLTDSPVAGKYADELAAKVLEKRPENQDAMLYALKGLMQRENWQEAYNISKKLIQTSQPQTEVVEQYVSICIKLGKNNEAYEYAKKQLELNPNDETLLQAYVLAFSKVNTRDAVIKYIDSLMGSSSAKMKSYLYYRRSFLQLTEENMLADLRSSLISNPRNSDALFRLYEMYYAKQDYRKAQYYLRQVVAINPNDTSVKQLNEALTKLIK